MPLRSHFRLPKSASCVFCLACVLSASVFARAASAQATFTVTTLTDAATGNASNCSNQVLGTSLDAACSLRDALAAAAAMNRSGGTSPITISFASSLASVGNPGTLTLGANALALPANTTVQGLTSGNGYSLTNLISIAGNGHEVFTADASVTQSALQNLTLTSGAPALRNAGSITVSQCTFANNAYTSGGALYNSGTLAIIASTFTKNSATSYGAAIYSTSDAFVPAGVIPTGKNLTITASTFRGNSSAIDGGAIYIGQKSVGAVDSSTFTGNTAVRDGAAIYINNGSGLSRVTNSILTGDTGGNECAGFGCDSAARAFTLSGSEPAGVSESGTITVTITLSTGQVIAVSQPYGMYSTAASIAAGFGGYISNNYYPTLTAQSFDTTLLVVPSTATLTSVVFQNPSKYFTITPVPDSVLSGTGNTVSVGTAAANLSALGSYGGPTQTVLPLPGSVALCATTPASPVGTDQRGLPRTTPFGSALCQDSGAVQTNYALVFSQPNSTTVNTVFTPSPSVQLLESGQKLSQANALVTSKDLSGSLSGGTTGRTVATGLATFPNLTVTKAQTQDTLTASLTVGANSVSATSSTFDVTPRPTALLAGNSTFPLTALSDASSRVFTFTNTGTATLNITALSVSSAPEWTQTNTCGLTLSAGASCAITVNFRPTVEGTRSGLLTLASDALGYPQTVALTGSAASPAASLTGTAAFPNTVVGSSAPAQTFTLANTGTVALGVSGILVTGDYSQSNGCGVLLAPGATCSIAVAFTPTALGIRAGTLTVASNAGAAIPVIMLNGLGVPAPAFTLSDNTSGGTATAITVAAGSTGTGVVKLTSINGFAGSVALTCVAQGTAPMGATCTVVSPVVLLTGGTATATVSISTTSRVLPAGLVVLPRRLGYAYLYLLVMLSTTAMVGLRSASRFAQAGSLLLLLVSLSLGLSGCGGGASAPSSTTTTSGSANPNGTLAGTYSYTITATSGSLTSTQTVVVTVQ